MSRFSREVFTLTPLGSLPAIFSLFILTGCGDPIVPPPPIIEAEWITWTQSTSPLLNDRINAIAIHQTEIWVASDAGVNRLRGSSWETFPDSFYFTIGPIESRKVNAVHIDNIGAAWFGLAGGGIRYFNSNSDRNHWARVTSPTLTNDFIYGITSDIQGDVWIATGNGVTRFSYAQSTEIDEGNWRHYTQRNSLIPDQAITSINYNYFNNTVWFGTTNIGAISYDGDLDWNISLANDNPLPIISMTFTPDRHVWFGTFSDWAYDYSIPSFEWKQVGYPDSGGGLPGNIVNAVCYNEKGTWFGTNNGLAYLTGGNWTAFDTGNSPLLSNIIMCLSLDPRGNLWIGTATGLYKYKAGGTLP